MTKQAPMRDWDLWIAIGPGGQKCWRGIRRSSKRYWAEEWGFRWFPGTPELPNLCHTRCFRHTHSPGDELGLVSLTIIVSFTASHPTYSVCLPWVSSGVNRVNNFVKWWDWYLIYDGMFGWFCTCSSAKWLFLKLDGILVKLPKISDNGMTWNIG